MNLSNKLWFALCMLVVALLGGCATYETIEFANEITFLRKHMPSERLGIDGWGKEQWVRGHSDAQMNAELVEYVRPPETVENWTELLTATSVWRTSKTYPSLDFYTFSEVPDPLDVMERVKLITQHKKCANPISFKKLDEERTGPYPSVMFYIACDKYLSAPPPLPTAEASVYRVLQGKHGLHEIRRSKRAASLDKATLDDWTLFLKRFYLCDNSVQGQECKKKNP